jgi:hypothetical protein
MTKESDPKENTAPNIIGKPSPAGPRWPPLPADHPLFKRGFVFGVRRSTPSSGATPTPKDSTKTPK